MRSVASGRPATVPGHASGPRVARRVADATGVATRNSRSRSPTETSGCINVTCASVRLVNSSKLFIDFYTRGLFFVKRFDSVLSF